MLIQRIYSHFKKAPPTHKLGVLYVVDSVTRGWVEQAKKDAQSLGPSESAKDGTYAAGHKLVTEMLPSFVNETINRAPEDQKVRFLDCADAVRPRSCACMHLKLSCAGVLLAWTNAPEIVFVAKSSSFA